MLAGLREAKLSTSKMTKVRYFQGGKTEDYIQRIGECKEAMTKFYSNCKNIVISSPIVWTDKEEANNILKKYKILKQEERNVIFHNNISASHLHRDSLHLDLNGTIILAGNLLSRIRKFWHNEDFNKATNLSNDGNGNNINNSSNYKSLINDNSAIQLDSVKSVLKRLRSNHPQQIIIGHLNINSVRNKFDIMKPTLLDYIDIFINATGWHRYFCGYRNKISWFFSSFTI